MISVRIINKGSQSLPAYASPGASGLDLRADIPETLYMDPGKRVLVPTGLHLEIPAGLEAQIRPRSGLALHKGITCLNSPGTIDSDFRGELKVLLINLSDEAATIDPGERIAQMVFQKIEIIAWESVTELTSTLRNEGGFGHTGLK